MRLIVTTRPNRCYRPWAWQWRSRCWQLERQTTFGCWCPVRWRWPCPTALRTVRRTVAARWQLPRQYSAQTRACWRTDHVARARTVSDNVTSTCRWRPENPHITAVLWYKCNFHLRTGKRTSPWRWWQRRWYYCDNTYFVLTFLYF